MPKTKKQEVTKTRIKSTLRQLWGKTQRGWVLKRDKYTCQYCGLKQTKKGLRKDWIYVQVHHENGLDWSTWDTYMATLFCALEDQVTLCEECHDTTTKEQACLKV